jgi:adenylate cyclase, class 2
MTSAGSVEREIKLRMDDARSARAAVASLGALPLHARAFEDNWIYDRDQALRPRGLLLRLRRLGSEAILTFKGPSQVVDGMKVRTEIETSVGDAASLEAILDGLGFARVFRYQKFREAFSWRDATIVVDETPFGVFVEIEGSADTIREAAALLGAGPERYISSSYAQLFVEAGGSGDMVFADTANVGRAR